MPRKPSPKSSPPKVQPLKVEAPAPADAIKKASQPVMRGKCVSCGLEYPFESGTCTVCLEDVVSIKG